MSACRTGFVASRQGSGQRIAASVCWRVSTRLLHKEESRFQVRLLFEQPLNLWRRAGRRCDWLLALRKPLEVGQLLQRDLQPLLKLHHFLGGLVVRCAFHLQVLARLCMCCTLAGQQLLQRAAGGVGKAVGVDGGRCRWRVG